MQMPMNRPQHPYPPPMSPYPPQQYQPMRPVPPHHQSSASIPSVHGMLSPSPSHPSQFAPPTAPPPIHSPQINQSAPPPPKPPSPVPSPPPPQSRSSFEVPLPWQSFQGDFPAKSSRGRRKLRHQPIDAAVQLPPRPEATFQEETESSRAQVEGPDASVAPRPVAVETPATSNPPSEVMSTQPTTPTSSVPPQNTTTKPNNTGHTSVPSISIRPAVPNIPLPNRAARVTKTESLASESTKPAISNNQVSSRDVPSSPAKQEADPLPEAAPVKAAPKSWADLVRTKTAGQGNTLAGQDKSPDTSVSNGIFSSRTSSLAEVLNAFKVKGDAETKTAFLEPRGLVNTGNMCYMNSVCFSWFGSAAVILIKITDSADFAFLCSFLCIFGQSRQASCS